MTKQEALTKIKELEEYVKNCDKPEPPEVQVGQVFKMIQRGSPYKGVYYMVRRGVDRESDMTLVSLNDHDGHRWSSDSVFGATGREHFEYIGMFNEVFEFKPR